jgi:predicted transcriptional regulator
MARRGKVDIIADILNAAKGGSKRTRVVYKTNLNFTIFQEYLDVLVERGLIERFNGQVYTTDRGLEYIRIYDDLYELMDLNGSKRQSQSTIKFIDTRTS